MSPQEEPAKLEAMRSDLKKEANALKLDFAQLKSGGFIKQTQKNLFTIRLRCPAGLLTSAQLRAASEIADKYGRGEVHISVRQSVEIPYVHYQHFDAVTAALKAVNWSVASCGPRIRVPGACAGCTYNPNGVADSQRLALDIDRRFFGMATGHHKFKISAAGCPIDCPRSRGADLGFQGEVGPRLEAALCTGCELCVKACQEKALIMVEGLPARDDSKCNYCGDCIKACPVDAMVAARKGWLVRAGGKHGKHPLYSYEVANFVSQDDALTLVEKTMDWYKSNADGRERLGATFARLGVGKYISEVIEPMGLEAIKTVEQRRRFWAGGNFYV